MINAKWLVQSMIEFYNSPLLVCDYVENTTTGELVLVSEIEDLQKIKEVASLIT
jgi:hypothetical protein